MNHHKTVGKWFTAIAVIILFLAASNLLAGDASLSDDKLHVDVMPYLVLAGMGGDATVLNHTVPVNASGIDVLSHLKMGFMGRTTFSYNRWFAATDLTYMRLGQDNDQVDLSLSQWMFELTGGYRVSPYLKVLGGVRYNNINGNAAFKGPLGLVPTGSQTWWDPIVGGQATLPLGKKLSASARFDVGGFGAGSKIAINAEPLLNYQATKRMTLNFGWKFLYQDYKNSSRGFEYNMLVQGPFMGFNFRF
jgi:hypothetical protein